MSLGHPFFCFFCFGGGGFFRGGGGGVGGGAGGRGIGNSGILGGLADIRPAGVGNASLEYAR